VIVVDANVIGYLFLFGERSEQAEDALRKDSDWTAPVLWRSEFRNVLTTYLHQNVVSLEDAMHIISEAESLMEGGEYAVGSPQVLRLAKSSGCSAYDCEFVALAQDLNVPLVTVDQRILSHFPNVSIALDEFVST
jgi:predicted nucleic acid-binding protein